MALTPGARLGPYEILVPIGAGGMGEVWRARDTKLDRDVAIKVLPAALADNPERLARFEREAKVLAALNHPNIAQIYGVEQGALVMELVEGATLSGPLPAATAINYARQIADALEAAHEKAIVHRDLKPANIKVTPQGVIKVLDFGLAAFGQTTGSRADASISPTLTLAATQMGVLLGTAGYMSPEQAAGKPVDKRADIWSFGVVFWEMLTGRPLFDGETVSHTLAAVLTKDPDWTQLPPDTPPVIRKLLKRCLERDLRRRLPDIGAARLELEDAMAGQSETPAALAPHSQAAGLRHGLPWIFAAVAAVAAVAFGLLYFRQPQLERPTLQYTVAGPEKARNVAAFAISPNGHSIVMVASGDTGTQLWVRSFDSLQAQQLAGTDGATYPFWSPDSRYVAFFAQSKLKKISVNGGPAQTLCDAPTARGGAWNRDGVIVFAPTNNGGLNRVPAVGGVSVPVTKTGGGFHRAPVFLPDGRHFLYLASGGNANGIYLASLDGTENRRLLLDVSRAEYLAPSGSDSIGHLLFVRDQTLMAQPVDPRTLEPKGDLFPVAEQVGRGTNTGDNLYSSSANGVLVYLTGGIAAGRQHVWFDRAGKELGADGGVARTQNNFALSPDGKRLITVRVGDVGGRTELWMSDLTHGTESRFTFDPSANNFPVWSPDGEKVAFASNRRGGLDLYQRASNGTGQDEVLFHSQETKAPWDWSRDGRYLIYRVIDPKTSDDIWALPLVGDKKPVPLVRTEFQEMQGQISPDGRWLAYTSNESGHFEVLVQPFAPASASAITGKWQISTAGGTQPRWRADGKELYYMATDRKLMAVAIKSGQSFDRGAPEPLFESRSYIVADNPLLWGYLPSPDGKRFLIVTAPGDRAEVPPLTVVVNWLAGVRK